MTVPPPPFLGLTEAGLALKSNDAVLAFAGDDRCLAYSWQESDINNILRPIAADFVDESTSRAATLTLRAVLGEPFREIRLDWSVGDQARTFTLPGLIQVTLPAHGFLSLIFGAGDRPLTHVALVFTPVPDNNGAFSPIQISSNFAWEREENRELHNEAAENGPETGAFFTLELVPQGSVSLVLLDFDVTEFALPHLLRQMHSPLQPLDLEKVDSLCQIAPAIIPLRGEGSFWQVNLSIDLDALELPFLKGNSNQFLKVRKPPDLDERIQLNFDKKLVDIPLILDVRVGNLSLSSDFRVLFSWETFALRVDHGQGIDLVLDTTSKNTDFLGLSWTFVGTPVEAGPNKGKYHLLTLVTDKHNFQLVQPKGAYVDISYDTIGTTPLIFRTTDFRLTPDGISLTTTVLDEPVKLNGLETKFRFNGSGLSIVNSQIQSFTLAGTGPLPPALVGEATANIRLEFGRLANGNLTLKNGHADLVGNKLLHCKGTRFQFAIDKIGLEFVNDGKFHLYFTLTGSARFVLASGDDPEGALALLPNIQIDLIDTPLTGDATVIAQHVKFLIELPKPVSFNFLGCFEMELRAIGFVPQAEVFGGDGAMQITGQLKFAQGPGDTPNSRPDYHRLFIGLPAKGKLLPRLHFEQIAVNLSMGEAFKLQGVVDFRNNDQEEGFLGEGMLQIQGLPTMAAAFGFLRVRQSPNQPWLRAWFIYIEVRRVSFMIPVLQIYLREVGLGFGYRFTLASIKAVDRIDDVKKLVAELDKLSRTQGDLSKRDRWAVDIEPSGRDPRWTIVLRAMISQTAASPAPTQYNASAEANISCLFLFDVVIAFRSDFTFLMAGRAWLNTNYHDFDTDNEDLRQKPLFTGYILLSPRQKRFLARVASNPDGKVGPHPQLPDFAKKAIESAQFSATLLIEPGLLHFELGWPNMLRWSGKLGPLAVDIRGGFIFRISYSELVLGSSIMARGSIKIEAGFSAGIVGVKISAYAEVAYGARYIGVLDFKNTGAGSAFYAGIGLELFVEISIAFWIKFAFFKKTFRFSVGVGFTASLEVGILGNGAPGLRGRGTVALKAMGRSLRFGVDIDVNGDAVAEALERTNRFLDMGLEATEVDPLPGTASRPEATRLAAPATAFADRTARMAISGLRAGSKGAAGESTTAVFANGAGISFHAPNYSAFVVSASHEKSDEKLVYLLLFPQGEQADGSAEPGFLPVPPADGVTVDNDFVLTIPGWDGQAGIRLEQYDPQQQAWIERPLSANGETSFAWQANWDAIILSGEQYREDQLNEKNEPVGEPEIVEKQMRDYLREAFLQENEMPVGDPVLPTTTVAIPDERVQNPSESAFEAAVRGAVKQFRGSPFFKRDPNYEYDRLLSDAFAPTTSLYHPSGQIPEEESEAERVKRGQIEQVDQLRSVIMQDLIADTRAYAETGAETEVADSVAFQMGLVFRLSGDAQPPWLRQIVADTDTPAIRQRLDPQSGEVATELRQVRTFNIPSTSFHTNPPQFQQVRHYTSANTIAITWDLTWESVPAAGCTPCQAEPEHHLLHYQVRRRSLDRSERELFYTVVPVEVLHQDGYVLKSLRPRFQIVDNFNHETLDAQAALPAAGLRYLYTITPVDFAGNLGRPLSLVATRYPDEPPKVPVDAELTVTYQVPTTDGTLPEPAPTLQVPSTIRPQRLSLRWSEPSTRGEGPRISIAQHRLIFRREKTLPIGSYGLDSATQRSRAKSLPSSFAMPQASDIAVELAAAGSPGNRTAEISLDDLKKLGIFPNDADERWRPEAWQLYIQTESANGVPSALAPVSLRLQVEAAELTETGRAREERTPAELEWLPEPTRLPLLPPEDQRAINGRAHFPMPMDEGFCFNLTAASDNMQNVRYRKHPLDIRCIRFRWNQGASQAPDYPLLLNAGYQLFELDIDAHTTQTFTEAERLGQALRTIQEVQMLPADELALAPADTLNPNQWEAWYPSAVKRLAIGSNVEGARNPFSPWYSWRESYLRWPAWAGLTDGDGRREKAYHPALEIILEHLTDRDNESELPRYTVDLQGIPPFQPMTLETFLANTAPDPDPYGWGVLQRLGLSMTFSLRDAGTGEIFTGQPLLALVQAALRRYRKADDDGFAAIASYLHVELLVQPGKRVSLKPDDAFAADSLLAMVQLSLRPYPVQRLRYSRLTLRGPAGTPVVLRFSLNGSVTVINQADLTRGPVDLEPDAKPIAYALTLPLNGETNILLRSAAILATEAISVEVKTADGTSGESLPSVEVEGPVEFAPTSEFVTYFVVPSEALGAGFVTEKSLKKQWSRLKRYLEALNSSDNTAERIQVPTNQIDLTQKLPDFLAWSQRFFDHGPLVIQPGDQPAAEADGHMPWLATAYPRVSSPAYAAPDANGRLQYDHLLEDKWAHTYRYYIQPFGRYEALWRAIRQSPNLFPEQPAAPTPTVDVLPDPEAGGLDVVLDRIHPLSKPLILRSGRLDAVAEPGQPVLPGRTWEVLVAQHPEQALMERNQTLARRLAFRQLAFTLLRRFTYERWLTVLKAIDTSEWEIQVVIDQSATVPPDYPAQPDHINLDGALDEDTLSSLDLPGRMDDFQQGVLALQWEALPFYYEHRLILVAQAAAVASPINEIIQQDFAYQAPPPPAPTLGAALVGDERQLQVTIDLQRLWDSLPSEAQAAWPFEDPATAPVENSGRVPGSLPDPGVVYQIIDVSRGNVEVQAEILVDAGVFDGDDFTLGENPYTSRQLGKRFTVAVIPTLTVPTTSQAYYALSFRLRQRQEEALSCSNYELDLPRLRFEENVLVWYGVLLAVERDRLLEAIAAAEKRSRCGKDAAIYARDRATVQRIYEEGFCGEPISRPIEPLPENLLPEIRERVDFAPMPNCTLVWHGAMTAAERADLLALRGDSLFRAALQQLAEAAAASQPGDVMVEIAPLGPEQPPPGLPDGLTYQDLVWHGLANEAVLELHRDEDGSHYTTLHWQGVLYDEEKERFEPVLRRWAQTPELRQAVNALLVGLEQTEFAITLPTRPAAPPPVLADLTIGAETLTWVGGVPSDEERQALATLNGDSAFLQARDSLLQVIDADVSVPVSPEPDETLPPLPELLLGHLVLVQVDQSRQLQWLGPAPNDAQQAALAESAAISDRPWFSDGVNAITAAFNEPKIVTMAPLQRPDKIAEILKRQLVLTDNMLSWSGRLLSPAQLEALQTMSSDQTFDEDFRTAVNTILNGLLNQIIDVPMTVETRPGPDEPNPALQEKLIIGRIALRFHGLMLPAEQDRLQEIFAHEPDRQAVSRLYRSCLDNVLRDHKLYLRTRRGAAEPSEMKQFLPLPE